ncbi:metal ABC transporter ATP-binding protein [Ammoniphilus sp. CFH 90114]|uniref:metal ABC transporter ATP-binding protein n=1 Tax=Ammoniphilus sp. CFH 90114 TaxID=2493665 RepID=UPI00100DE8F1|nr:metal ABC transporter ATP-binding protein [Ammoniphilus sp. CFH 90114]RXT13543.1 metal ABC transporter ATP-binding protein [Ammoniphilus sp. CFH 90114]
MQPIIQCKDIHFNYSHNEVLKDVHFIVEQGDYVGLVGPNGSGKSTLLKIILGLVQPKQGEVKLFGIPTSSFKDWYKIGYVSQKANSFNSGFPATVYEVVSMGLYGKMGLFKRLNRQHHESIMEAIEQVGLSSLADRNIGKLSGGQQQRAFIARALVSKPSLLILDEPTVGVDTESVDRFYHLLAKLHQEHQLTLLMVTHDIGMMTHHVNKVACLNKRIHFHGDPSDFQANQQAILERAYGSHMNLVEHRH